MSHLDTPMFRAMAMIVHLDTPEMVTRAHELQGALPNLCCVSEVSPWKERTPERPYLYYQGNINEEWVKTGKGLQLIH